MSIKHTLNRIMVLKGGSPARHKMGNIGRKEDDYIRVYAENNDEYIGIFEEGFGFIDVIFNKSDCRMLNQSEVELLNGQVYTVNGQIYGAINIDNNGDIVANK